MELEAQTNKNPRRKELLKLRLPWKQPNGGWYGLKKTSWKICNVYSSLMEKTGLAEVTHDAKQPQNSKVTQ